ncbi:Transglycosylase [Sphingomonas sp. T1]|uniref:GlsB/YeaQ/YmgE family stress response membrane protein n=1 Tax=Sphingomonas sp. T1 TaxID=2653172 RepID=UPI0012F35D7B|nr:Transglycosylase [Sphingomonas sp. T1]
MRIGRTEDCTINLIILLVVGGIIGWVASMIIRTDEEQSVILNVVVGIVGAVLAKFIITRLIGGDLIMDGAINIQSVLISLVGTIFLLATVNLVRRGSVR